MWPVIDEERKEISLGGDFLLRDLNVNVEEPNISIKEIVMLYSQFEEVSYNKDDVVMAVSYDTEYGEHMILFSKVQNLQYEDNGFGWTATYSSDPKSQEKHFDDGKYLEEEVLTAMFRNLKVCDTHKRDNVKIPSIVDIRKE